MRTGAMMRAVWHGLHQSASKQQSSKPSCMCHAGERARWARRPAIHVHLVLHLRCARTATSCDLGAFSQNTAWLAHLVVPPHYQLLPCLLHLVVTLPWLQATPPSRAT